MVCFAQNNCSFYLRVIVHSDSLEDINSGAMSLPGSSCVLNLHVSPGSKDTLDVLARPFPPYEQFWNLFWFSSVVCAATVCAERVCETPEGLRGTENLGFKPQSGEQ